MRLSDVNSSGLCTTCSTQAGVPLCTARLRRLIARRVRSAGRTFQPLIEPPAHLKNMQGMPGQPSMLVLQTRGSKFVKFQEIRIQELADEVRLKL